MYSLFSKQTQDYTHSTTKGFTMLELVVSVGIMLGIISMVLSNQNTYTEGASLKNLANDIGLSLRQAQIYGISVKALPNTEDFTGAFGIDFNLTSGSGNNTMYLFFADRGVQDGYYNYTGDWAGCPTGGTSECLQKMTTSTGNIISSLCPINNDDVSVCAEGVVRADITFLRPETSASIVLFVSNGGQIPPTSYKGVEINLASVSGGTRSVRVYDTGQISVN